MHGPAGEGRPLAVDGRRGTAAHGDRFTGLVAAARAASAAATSLALRAWERAARFSSSTTAVSRRRRLTSSGVAMKIEEYAPMRMPTNSTSERSSSTPGPRKTAPTASTAVIGSRPMTVVLIERTIVWLTARLAASAKVSRPFANASLVFSRTLSKTTTVSYRL